MTALGLVEGVKRTLYRDDVLGVSAYPLDEKIGLLNINGNCSRYTQVFSWHTARLYAELTEEDASLTLKELLGIEINKSQVAEVGRAVSECYIHLVDADEDADLEKEHLQTDVPKETTYTNRADSDVKCNKVMPEGFLAEKLRELEARPDKDTIISNALDGKLIGSEGGQAKTTAMYILADGTGVPGLRRELSKNGKNGGRAGTFEAKIGCSFRQGFTEDGIPVLVNDKIERVTNSTKYIGTTDRVDGFSPLLADFAQKNGMHNEKQIVFLSDGAIWLSNVQMQICPTAIVIIDFYHAAEHLNDIIGTLRFHSHERRAEFSAQCLRELELGNIENLAALIRGKTNSSNEDRIEKQLAYFERNTDKMRYGLFRAVGLFIGSGVMEAGCKTIVCKRLKNAGMHWSKKNAKALIALRCAICSNEFEIPSITPVVA